MVAVRWWCVIGRQCWVSHQVFFYMSMGIYALTKGRQFKVQDVRTGQVPLEGGKHQRARRRRGVFKLKEEKLWLIKGTDGGRDNVSVCYWPLCPCDRLATFPRCAMPLLRVSFDWLQPPVTLHDRQTDNVRMEILCHRTRLFFFSFSHFVI